MRISELRIHNYRTITELSLKFPQYYTALCGKNDAGKSNIIRALRSGFQNSERVIFYVSDEISLKEDFTKWKEKETPATNRFIQFVFVLQVNRNDDEGLHRFLKDYLALSTDLTDGDSLELTISLRKTADESEQIGLLIGGVAYEALKAQEVYKRLRFSLVMLFHDSTEFFHPYRFRQSADPFRQMSGSDKENVKNAQVNVNKVLSKIAKRSQQDLTEMLGRLKNKYKIGLSIANADIREVPYKVTLGTADGEVDLENWGSGTQNKTRILMTMFKAKQVREANTSSDKVTPIIVIEEPESYLHPSAQAEFGRTLRDLAEEFQIQVIVTTHSPYLLSLHQSNANILLERKKIKRSDRDTQIVDTSGQNWMDPFCLALGTSDTEMGPWREALFSGKDSLLLVEGETDKEYFTLLQDNVHGDERLLFDGTIFAYGGKDTLKQQHLIRFLKSQFKRFIVTYDLDSQSDLDHSLKAIGLTTGVDCLAIGKTAPGKQSIEGLLPDVVFQTVYSANVDLVQRATAATGAEAKSAKSSLKRAYLDEFKSSTKPKTEHYKAFYALTKQLNRMLSRTQ